MGREPQQEGGQRGAGLQCGQTHREMGKMAPYEAHVELGKRLGTGKSCPLVTPSPQFHVHTMLQRQRSEVQARWAGSVALEQ